MSDRDAPLQSTPVDTPPTPLNTTCPWSGNPVTAAGATQYRGQTVAFCNPGCKDKFETATSAFDAAIDAAQADDLGSYDKLLGEPYRKRHFTQLGTHQTGDSVFKLYRIGLNAERAPQIDASALAYVDAFAQKHLNGEQVGFVMSHPGEEADWLLIHWWIPGGILSHHVAYRDVSGGEFVPASDLLLACVWEQIILEYERKAWVQHVLTPNPSIAAYVQDAMPDGAY